MQNQIPDETLEEGYFGQYRDDSFLRGWDSMVRRLGNRRATIRPPVPGCADEFFRGQSLVERIVRVIGGNDVQS